MNLQPLYDVKERLESAAIAGTGLLGEDFRLKRAAEALKPLAAASPVFAKIDAGLTRLLSVPPEERAGLLLDTLALVDAVAYTQAGTGGAGELEPLRAGSGQYRELSYSQLTPLLTALTTTGGGRQETIKSAWENHPEFFEDYRVLPALVAGLGDSYGEIADQNAKILEQVGPAAVPLLKKDFDPAGNKAMARRVEVIAAIEGTEATPWLKEMLPLAKKDVRTAVLTALGVDRENAALLLDLAKAERGKNREAVLAALARQDGEDIRLFWEEELGKRGMSVQFLNSSRSDWASDLVARGLWDTMERLVEQGGQVPKEVHAQIWPWWAAAKGKASPSMLDLWRWADGNMEAIGKLKNHVGQPLGLSNQIVELLLDSTCQAGPGPLCGLCLELWERHKSDTRYLPHAVAASLMTRNAGEVYDTFSPYVPTMKPLLGGASKQQLHNAVLKGLSRLSRGEDGVYRIDNTWPAAQPLDRRWVKRLSRAVWKTTGGKRQYSIYVAGESMDEYDLTLVRLSDLEDEETRRILVPYFREKMVEHGLPLSYSRCLFRLGTSPKGVLAQTLGKGNPIYLYTVWSLLSDAAKYLSAGEVAQLCQEVMDANHIRKEDARLAQLALPWTMEQLKAGKPFPEWNDWWKMRL